MRTTIARSETPDLATQARHRAVAKVAFSASPRA